MRISDWSSDVCSSDLLRIDLLFPFAAGKDAIMADARLEVMALQMGTKARAERVGGRGLAHGADIVLFPFDRQQRGLADRARIDLPPAIGEFALGPPRPLEHPFHRLQRSEERREGQ